MLEHLRIKVCQGSSAVFAIAVLVVLATVWSASTVAAQQDRFERSEVFHYPENGSYYQLVIDFRGHIHGPEWQGAVARSKRLSYDGRQGRLAIIDSSDLHAWIVEKIMPLERPFGGNVWIGLRYWCSFRELHWSDGSVHPFDGFGAWNQPWRAGIGCGTYRVPYMGVHLRGDNLMWFATGHAKRWPVYLVEYPAPE